jgi:hypothetical protein
MTKSRGIIAPRQVWTKKQLALLAKHYPHKTCKEVAVFVGRPMHSCYQKANELGIKKTPEFLASGKSGRLDGVRGGNTKFKPGHSSWNKGTKGIHTGGVETQFKKGHRGGKALEVYKPIGTERISKDGYLERKVNDDMPMQGRWRAVHLLLWESVHGPVNGKTHAVIFKNGNKRDIRIENLELVTRAELMKRNSYHNYGKEVAALIQLRGALVRKINNRTRKANGQ